jgi:hypothetical protein
VQFKAGYEAGVEDAGSGELLDEADALQHAFFNLDGKQRRAIALDELAMAVQAEVMDHVKGCCCGLCMAVEQVLKDLQ